ncbi:hypothetical protein WJX77_006430 [Trebouxia sp. C0004]
MMLGRNVRDLESQGSFLRRASSIGRAISSSSSFGRRKSVQDSQERELLQGRESSSSEEQDRPHKPKACERVNSLARTVIDSEDATAASVQAVSKEPYDEDMQRKYAKHLKASERVATKILLSLKVENPQKVLWMVAFLLIFGLSFMAEFLQTLPLNYAAHVARRSENTQLQFEIYGWGLPIAKGAAQTIKVAVMFILFPVARSVLTFLRRASFLKCVVPFDSNLTFHRFFGYVLFTFSWIHTFAHVANSINQTKASSNIKSLMCYTDPPGTVQNCSPYEMAFGPKKFGHGNTLFGWWTSETAITGIIMLAILCIGYPCAVLRSSSIARKVIKDTSFIGRRIYSFTCFFFSHQFMTISFYIAVVLHPLPGKPGNPRPHSSTTWVYVLVGVLAYVIDRTLRLYRQATWETTVLDARILPGGVLELKLKKPRNTDLWRAPQFKYMPGQYAHLNVPQISWAEWHPFTITSVPSDEFIMFHIKSAGDWTALLHQCISRQLAANSTAMESSGRRLTRSSQHVPNLASPSSSNSTSLSSSLSPLSSRSLSPSEQPGTALSGRTCELSTVSEVALPHMDSARLRSSVMRPANSTGQSTAESQQSPNHKRRESMESVISGQSERYADAMGWPAPLIHIDGPCGAPAQNYKDYKVLLLVGGNIGVTPFISILRKLLTNMEMNMCSNCGQCDLKHIKHKHVYFFWTVRDEEAMQYFTSTFAAVKKLDTHGILDIRIHLTTRKPDAAHSSIQVGANSGSLQTPSSLGLKIYPGRPDWRAVFQTVCVEYPKETVGVFCCGPLGLTQDLKVLSREYSLAKSQIETNGGSKRKGQATRRLL